MTIDTPMPRVLSCIIVACCLLAGNQSRAQEGDAAARIAALEAELALARMKLADYQKKLAGAETGGEEASPDGAAASSERAVRNLADVLKRFPDEAQPDRDGTWSSAAAAAAHERLTYSLWGTPFNASLTLQQVEASPNPAAQQDASASPWKITMRFEQEQVDYRGTTIRQQFEPVVYFGDAGAADRARRIKPGQSLRVRGDIMTASVSVFKIGSGSTPLYILRLRDVSIAGW